MITFRITWLGLASIYTYARLDELNTDSVHISCCLPMFLDLLKDLLHLSNPLPAYSIPFHSSATIPLPLDDNDTSFRFHYFRTSFSTTYVIIICLHAFTIISPSRIAISFMLRYLCVFVRGGE